MQVCDVFSPTRRAYQQAQLGSFLLKQLSHMAADKSGCSGYEGFHGWGVLTRESWMNGHSAFGTRHSAMKLGAMEIKDESISEEY
jgi:hypothetical protein